jgi:uncharacterized protein (TIGR02302 family)
MEGLMTDTTDGIRDATLKRLHWPLRLTRAGMLAERITRGFWPVWTILFVLIAALGFGAQDVLAVEVVWFGGVLAIAGLIWAMTAGVRQFRLPTLDEALARLDARLPGRPIAALTDVQALGQGDAGTSGVWRAHLGRMADRAARARADAPDLRVASRDPFALRYVAATAVVLAVIFGSIWRLADVSAIAKGGVPVTGAVGPTWEAWIEPPAYTGKPSLYLNKIEAATLEVPEGSRATLRLYGAPEDISVTETVSGQAAAAPDAAAPATSVRAVQFEIVRSGSVTIDGTGGRSFDLTVLPDAPPTVAFEGDIKREADGTMSQPFKATDDYAVAAGRATVTLDLAVIDRRYGLAADPEPQEDITYDLPMPITGSRADFNEALVEDASKHPWANLPVKMMLEVTDGRGQAGKSETRSLPLPGRRFFDPLASAVIEMRRDLLWTRANGPRVAQILRALTFEPEGFMKNERAFLMLRVAMRRLDAGLAQGMLSPVIRDEMAEALWEIAVLIEDSGLSDALARMQQAQERLSEAIRNGASPEEIQKLMNELKDATDNYIEQLAQNMENKGDGTDERDQQAQNEGQQITGDQIQQMMDEIQKLMEEGRMAEAQELLDQLSRMMENLKVTQGQGGEGQDGPGGKAMKGLQDTLKGQQGLSDDSFRDLQNQFGQGQPGQDQPGQGQQPGQDQQQPGQDGQQGDGQGQGQDGTGQNDTGQNGQGQPGQDEGKGQPPQGSLADRQQALRDQLRQQQQGQLPGEGTDEGKAARQALDQAGRAMDDAEKALRDGDLSGALDKQAEAIENLREGMRSMGEALAQGQQQQRQPGQQGEAFGDAGRELPRDPLGRSSGTSGRIGTDENLLQGEDVYRRARDILDEIRRRSGEQSRPKTELDYLKRLLGPF